MKKIFICTALLLNCIIVSQAQAMLVINPSDDGSIYSSGSVSTTTYLMSSGDIRGVAEFSLSGLSPNSIGNATFSVNPYGLPLWDKTVDVYGYGSSDGALTFSDYAAGNFLGVLTLPDSLDYGEITNFDVTAFLKTVNTPFVGFNLRTSGADVFSSLEYNNGSPSQLSVTTIPEPTTLLLFSTGLLGAFLRRRKG